MLHREAGLSSLILLARRTLAKFTYRRALPRGIWPASDRNRLRNKQEKQHSASAFFDATAHLFVALAFV